MKKIYKQVLEYMQAILVFLCTYILLGTSDKSKQINCTMRGVTECSPLRFQVEHIYVPKAIDSS